MSDYIRREDAIEEIRKAENHAFNSFYKGLVKAHKIVADLPPADVEPVAYGRWVYVDDDDMRYDTYYCSECRNRITVDSHRRDDIGFTIDDMKRCNKCGARMG